MTRATLKSMLISGAALSGAMSMAPVHALAAEAARGTSAATLEELIVTARRREEDIQTVRWR
jgi:outer membrane cobalamin receptor